MNVICSVILSTKNRKDELRRALRSCLLQQPLPEIMVMDDGSTDGTSEMVRADFPGVTLHRSEISQGYIHQRNRAAELARGEFVVSLDDDAEFSSPYIVRQTLAAFADSRVGAVTIPWKNVPEHQSLSDQAPDEKDTYVCRSYTGMAHAVRRDIFLQVGGYREFLLHGSEEIDFCVRLMDAGYFVRLGCADHVNHYESKIRNVPRQAYFAARNAVLFAWCNAPGMRLPIHTVGTVVHVVSYGLKNGYLWSRGRGLVAGVAYWVRQWQARRPVSQDTYRLYRRLTHCGILPLSQIAIPDSKPRKPKNDACPSPE